MRALPLTFLSTAFLAATVGLAQTNPTARSVPFVEPFPSGTFSTYATGFQGWNGLSGAVINTQGLAEASVPTGDATITAANPVTASVAGIYGSNGRVVLRSGSDATNGVNQLAMAINTTGQSGVRLGYSITSILAGPVTMGVVCQFRVGNTGVWATLTPTIGANPYVQTSGFTGLKTTVGVLLPAGCDNQPLVQVRWAVWRGTQAGNSAAFGIDDVAVTLIANDECSGAIDLPLQDPGNCPANALVGTTVGATDSGVDCVVSGTDVWYKITGDAGQAATVFLTPGTAAGLGIQVFGTCGGSVFYCQPGTQHGIFAGFGSTTFVKVFAQTPGTFTICAVRAPANNAVFFATPLPSQHPDSCTALPGTTDFATNDGTIPCGLSPSAADVWYAVDGGAGFAVNIQLFPGSATDMGIQVFSDNGSTPTYCGTGNFHSFQAIGTNYRVRVFAAVPGTFSICAIRAPANNESFGAIPLPLRPAEECSCFIPAQGTCPPGETADCNGNCAPLALVGDGFCDDGSFFYNGAFISFNCPAFGSDGGDCSGGNGSWPPACSAQIDSTVFATNSGINCAFPTARDLWYSVTGTSSNTARIELFPVSASGLGIEVFDSGNTSVYCAAGNSHGFFLPDGQTYKVKVFTETPGEYHICAVHPPTNDEQSTAAPLTLHPPGTCLPLETTMAGATNAFPQTSCALPGSVDLWYTVTGGAGFGATIELDPGTATNMGIQVFDGQFGTETYCSIGNTHSFQVPSGSTYFVKVFAQIPGTFTLCATAAPDNNEAFGATPLTLHQPGNCTPLLASTAFATNSGTGCSSPLPEVSDVWFTVTGGLGMAVTIELTPITASGLGLQVRDGQFGNETYCGTGNTHSFQVPMGTTYFIKVSAAGDQGTFGICAIAAPDNNENFSPVALPVEPTGTCTGLAASTTYATNQDPNCEHPTAPDLWYTLTGPVNGTVTVELVPGTAADMGIEVFEDQFGSIGNVTYCAGGTSHTFAVPFGSSRFVKVFSATPGTFTVCATETAVECQQNSDCNDGDPCTIDACIAQECVTAPLISIGDVVSTPSLVCVNGNAQLEVQATTRAPLSQYVFSTETGAALDPMNQFIHRIYPFVDDEPLAFPTTIGFDFPFNGTLFSHFSVSPDGWLQLGGAQAVAQPVNSTTSAANNPKIYAYWDDLSTGTFSLTGGVFSKVSGTAPHRILKVQWGVTIPKNLGVVANSFFQLWLYENGTIEFRYGAMGAASMSASAGITAGPANFQSITLATNTVSAVSANDANTGQPASGRLYRFSLPPVAGGSYLWTPPTFLSSTTAASPMVTAINVPEQEYDVLLTSAGGCTATDSVTVLTTTPTTAATITGTPAFCSGGSTTLTAVPTDGGGPHTFLWSPGGETTASIVVSTAGTFSCVVSDPCGSVNAGSVNVIEKPVPSASATSNSPLCFGDTLLLDGSTDFGTTFQWTGPQITGFTATTEDASAPSVNAFFDNTFTFTASFDGCTSAPATVDVVVNSTPQMPTPTATPTSLCAGGNSQLVVDARENPGFLKELPIAPAPLSGTPTAITTWNAGGDNTANDGFSTPVVLPFPFKYDGRVFSQLWVSPNGYITFNNPAGVSAATSRISDFLTLSSAPNAVIALCWSDLNATSGGSIGTFTVGAPGSRVFVVNFNAVPFNPNTGAVSGQIHLHETTGRIELHLTTVTHGASTSPNRIGVEDFNGGSRTVISKFPAAWNISIPEAWRFDPLTFQWSPTTFLNDPTIANPVATAITASTTYTVTVTTPSGCTTTNTATVSIIPPLSSALISGIPALCDGAPTTLTAVPTGGGTPFTYLWSPDGQTTASISASIVGTYSCQVSDACGGSVNTGPLTVVAGSVPTANANSTGPVCEDQTLNLIGTTNFGNAFSWTGPNGFSSTQQNPSRTAMTFTEDGIYQFTAFSNGCPSVPDTVHALVHPKPVIGPVTASPDTVCPAGSSQLQVSASVDRTYVRISEVTTQRTGAGATPVYPAYLTAGIDDFVELNNTSGLIADISGWTVTGFISNGTSPTHPLFTFPPGTIMLPNSALVVGMGPGVGSPANQYYTVGGIGGNHWTSSGPIGVVLKNNAGAVVDALATGTSFVWAPVTGVTEFDWSNTTLAALTGRAGIIRTAASDTNLGSDWSNSDTGSPVQSIGSFNAGYANPYLSTVSGFAWSPATFLNSTTIANPLASGITAGTSYAVTVSGANNCAGTASVTVSVPVIDDSDVCTLDACVNGVVTHSFQDADGDGTCDANDDCPLVPGQIGSTCDDGDANTTNDVLDGTCTCLGTPLVVRVDARVFLEGPYNSTTGLMNDALRGLPGFPLTEPYTAAGYIHAGGGGGETVAPAVLAISGNNAIVDWVVLELRSPTVPANIIASRSALLQRDGDVVDMDGVSSVPFTAPVASCHVSVRHRNHLGAMTAGALALSPTPLLVDLTTLATATFGTNARKSITGTFPAQALWAGDVNFNKQLKYAGSNNDRDPILTAIGGLVPTNTLSGQYRQEDINMNGQVKYAGSANDRDILLQNIGGSVPTATRNAQLP